MKRQKKIALINDFSGFGRCSLMVSVPILSTMRCCCCALPTSVFSNHTAFESYAWKDLSAQMRPFMKEWEQLHLDFAGIYTGFLGSLEQIEIVRDFFQTFAGPETRIIVDPVMGDDGAIYPTYTKEMCEAMKELVSLAHTATPNVTEAFLLADREYQSDPSFALLEEIGWKILSTGCKSLVITGIEKEGRIYSCIFENGKMEKSSVEKVAASRPGTGDVFASVLAGCLLKGMPLKESTEKAERFVQHCLRISDAMEIPLLEGVAFEEILDELAG